MRSIPVREAVTTMRLPHPMDRVVVRAVCAGLMRGELPAELDLHAAALSANGALLPEVRADRFALELTVQAGELAWRAALTAGASAGARQTAEREAWRHGRQLAAEIRDGSTR